MNNIQFRDSVKKQIKKKFGSYSQFARLAKLNRYEFQRDFLTVKKPDVKYCKEVAKLCAKTNPTGRGVSEETRDHIRALIVAEHGGIQQFCKKHKQFVEVSVFQILDGTRKTITPKVKKFLAFFED